MEIKTPSLLIGLCLLVFLQCVNPMPSELRVGVLYEPEFEGQYRALHWAAQDVNLLKDILSQTLVYIDKDTVDAQDSFNAQRIVCRMSNEGIAAVFGPMSPLSSRHVESMCNTFEIPHVQWQWDPRDRRKYFSINLFPHYLTLSSAYKSALEYWRWTRFTILYETNEGLTRVQEVMTSKDDDKPPVQVTVRRLEMVDGTYLSMLKKLKDDGEFRFLIDCSLPTVSNFLTSAMELGLITSLYHYFFTSLDLGLPDLRHFAHAGANITGYRLIDPDNLQVADVRDDWLRRARSGFKSPLMGYSDVATETALAYDAFFLFAKAVNGYSDAGQISTSSLPCDKIDKIEPWAHGGSLINYMKSASIEGLSGRVQFDNDGFRKDFDLDLMYLTKDGLAKIGAWNRQSGLVVNLPVVVKEDITITGKKWNVSTYVTTLFVTRGTSNLATIFHVPLPTISVPGAGWNSSAPSGFSGFCVDLLQKIADAQNFTFQIHAETTVGEELDNKSWTGVMGALISRKADIGIGDLTINLLREQHIDFTKPFLTLGITILYKKPEPKALNLFSFLSPLSLDVWVYMIAAYLCVSFMLFVIARFSPYEWTNPHPCNPDTEEVENQFTVMNSLWFTIGSLMQQGCEIAPRALSTRLVAGMWWFFTLIMISSYTANLAAFLTVERMVADISSAEDLAKQTKIKYGVYDGGATMNFFKENTMPLYERMWNFMNSTPEDSFMKNSTAAVAKVRKGNFAYITESTTVQFVVQRNCNLIQVGGLLDSKGYGFATPTGSPIREQLTEEILRLKEKQEIEKLRVKWWEKELGGGKCHKEVGGPAGKAAELGVENVGGVFVVLMGGVVCGFFVSLGEFIWKARENANKDKQTLCAEMTEEFRFAVQCFGSNTKKTQDEEITDNGLQFMPLTGYNPHNSHTHGKEVYA